MTNQQNEIKNYIRFFTMIGVSFIVMFFLMYLHSYQILDHAWFSETRLFMALIMGAAMMVIMLGFMLGMYKNRQINIAIFLVPACFFWFPSGWCAARLLLRE